MRIDYSSFVDQIKSNKYNEQYKITNHCIIQGKHQYDVVFLETKNAEMATYNQIKNGTIRDSKHRKDLKRLETQIKLRERNRLIKQPTNQFFFPEELKTKKILSIDLSTRSTGIAYANEGHILRWKTFKAEGEIARKRAYEITCHLLEVIKRFKFDAVILEDIYLGLNSTVLMKLAEARGMFIFHLLELDVPSFYVPAVWWKHKYQDMPVHRNEQKEYSKEKFFEYTGVKAEDDDSADAYLMLKAVLEN